MKKRAIISLRVSGKKQDTMTQLIDCRDYCERNDFEIVEEIHDKITGNSAVSERPGGKQIYDLLKRKAADVVLLWKIDRVARDEDVTEYMVFKRDVKRLGAELHFCDIGKTSDDPIGAQLEFAQAAGAAKERLNIIERTSKGRRKKFNHEKRLVLNGEPPFGYKKIGAQKEAYLTIDPVEGAIVGDIFAWYVRDRLSLWDILERVTATGAKPRRSDQWNKRRLIHLLHYEGYKGLFKYSGQTMVRPELMTVDPETRDKAQELLKANQWAHDKKGQYLLAGGHAQCHCGQTMTGSSSEPNLHYYRCHRGNSFPAGSPERCNGRVRADKLDKLAWGMLLFLALSPDGLMELIGTARQNIELEIEPLKDRLESLNLAIQAAESEIVRMTRRVAKITDDEVARPYQKEIEDTTTYKRGLTVQRDKTQSELDKYGFADGKIDNKAIEARLNSVIAARTFEDKRRNIEQFDVRAQIRKDGKILLSCYLMEEPEILELNAPQSYLVMAEVTVGETVKGTASTAT